MRARTRRFKHFAEIGLVVLVAGIVAVLLAASHASSANALPSALVGAEAELSSVDDIHLTSLPAGTTPHISQAAAEATALREFGLPLTTSVSAYAVSDTDNAWGTPQSDGTMQLKISNRPVWVVLIPNQTVQANLGSGQGTAPSETATLAVFVDANTGDFLMGSTVYP